MVDRSSAPDERPLSKGKARDRQPGPPSPVTPPSLKSVRSKGRLAETRMHQPLPHDSRASM